MCQTTLRVVGSTVIKIVRDIIPSDSEKREVTELEREG